MTDRYVNTTGSLPNGVALDADGNFLARMYANLLPLGILELPVDIPKIVEVVQWQKANDTDQRLMWVVDTIARLAKLRRNLGWIAATIRGRTRVCPDE